MKNSSLLVALVLALSLCGCGSSKTPAQSPPAAMAVTAAPAPSEPKPTELPSETPADPSDSRAEAEAPAAKEPVAVSELPDLPILPSYYGREMVSDGSMIYFFSKTEREKLTESAGLYRTDSSFGSFEMLFRGTGSLLCLDGELLYFMGSNGLYGGCRTVDTAGTEINRFSLKTSVDTRYPTFFRWGEDTYFLNSQALNNSPGDHFHTTFYAGSGAVVKAAPGKNGIWFSTLEGKDAKRAKSQSDGVLLGRDEPALLTDPFRALYLFDPETRTASFITRIGTYGFAVSGENVYCLSELPDQPEHDSPKQIEFELIYADADGSTFATGVTGRFGDDFIPYGSFIFYTKYTEVPAADGSGAELTVSRPFCYDTRSGTEYALDREEFADLDVRPTDVAAGWMYLRLYDVREDAEGTFRYNLLIDLTDADVSFEINSDEIYKNATVCGGVLITDKEDEEERAQREEAKKQYEEEQQRKLDNEPYGPGKSSLYLKAQSRTTCYKLVRVNGTVEFQVLLSPGTGVTKQFPSGRYRLKVAVGDTWISDEEAFGSSGVYQSTNLFTFEPGGSYKVGSGSGLEGGFFNGSQQGFTG